MHSRAIANDQVTFGKARDEFTARRAHAYRKNKIYLQVATRECSAMRIDIS